MSVNKVILIGRLGADPETRYMPNGDAVTNITLATTETWKNQNGEKQEKTEWHRCILPKKLAEIAGEYLKKADWSTSMAKPAGTRKWTDKKRHRSIYHYYESSSTKCACSVENRQDRTTTHQRKANRITTRHQTTRIKVRAGLMMKMIYRFKNHGKI